MEGRGDRWVVGVHFNWELIDQRDLICCSPREREDKSDMTGLLLLLPPPPLLQTDCCARLCVCSCLEVCFLIGGESHVQMCLFFEAALPNRVASASLSLSVSPSLFPSLSILA